MRSIFPLALGLVAAYPATMASAQSRDVSLRKECTRDRCVYYHGSTRAFSVEKEEGTKRVIVRDANRNAIAKVQEQDDGTIKVEKPRR